MEKKFKVLRLSGMGGSFPSVAETAKELSKVNAEIVEAAAVTEDEVIEAAKDADVILAGQAQMTRRVLEALPKCQTVIFGSVGYDRIDVDAATDNNIIVVNNPAPQWLIEEVTNHAIVLLLACSKKLTFLNNSVKQGRWAEVRPDLSPMGAIYGQTLGIIGCGSLGRMTAEKAQCLRLKVLGYDPYVDESLAKKSGITMVGLPELLKESDYVSAHVFLNKETRHLIGGKELKQMILEGKSMHINSAKHRFVTSSIVGGCIPIAVGVAIGIIHKSINEKVYVFVGDMAGLTGIFEECARYVEYQKVNIPFKKLPIEFIVECNGYSVNTPIFNYSHLPKISYSYYVYDRTYPHVGCGQWVEFK